MFTQRKLFTCFYLISSLKVKVSLYLVKIDQNSKYSVMLQCQFNDRTDFT